MSLFNNLFNNLYHYFQDRWLSSLFPMSQRSLYVMNHPAPPAAPLVALMVRLAGALHVDDEGLRVGEVHLPDRVYEVMQGLLYLRCHYLEFRSHSPEFRCHYLPLRYIPNLHSMVVLIQSLYKPSLLPRDQVAAEVAAEVAAVVAQAPLAETVTGVLAAETHTPHLLPQSLRRPDPRLHNHRQQYRHCSLHRRSFNFQLVKEHDLQALFNP